MVAQKSGRGGSEIFLCDRGYVLSRFLKGSLKKDPKSSNILSRVICTKWDQLINWIEILIKVDSKESLEMNFLKVFFEDLNALSASTYV